MLEVLVKIKMWLSEKQNILDLNPQFYLLGKYVTKNASHIFLNHLLFLFEYFVYKN